MAKVRCADCGMIATIPEINAKENWLADPSICPGSGPVYSCAGCGSKNLIGTSQVIDKAGSITSFSSNTVKPIYPPGFAECPKCGTVFITKSGNTSNISPNQPHPEHPGSAHITCPHCHKSAALKPKIPRSWLDSLCGTMKINCEICHNVIFEGRPS